MGISRKVDVTYHGRSVGTLIERNHKVAFVYDQSWLEDGFSISPFSLPLSDAAFLPEEMDFEGLFGVFYDSLPDGWARLLLDRKLKEKGIDPTMCPVTTKLLMIGSSGMGALCYQPQLLDNESSALGDLDHIFSECQRVLNNKKVSDLDELFRIGGSSGGARPKVLAEIDGEHWLIKFPSSSDRNDVGLMELEYAECARACGLRMMPFKLFPSRIGPGFFGVKRFDRTDGERIHMVSASALLESSHRIPNLDYQILMRLVASLCKDETNQRELFKLMCFNVYAHNRDDHSKNFSFLYDEKSRSWHLSPAYDLTYSDSFGGEHATTVAGNGRNPGLAEIIQVARTNMIDETWALETAREIKGLAEPLAMKYSHQG